MNLDYHRSCVARLRVSTLCDDAHSSCRGICLTQRVLRDCGILTMINVTWVATISIFCGVGTWHACVLFQRSFLGILLSRKTPSHTLSYLQFLLGTRLCLEEPSGVWHALVRQRHTGTMSWFLEAFENLNTQDMGERLRAATLRRHQGHLSSTWRWWRCCLPTVLDEI